MPQKTWGLPGPQVAPVNKCGCAEMSADSLFVNGRIDLKGAAQRLQTLKRLADLCRGLAHLIPRFDGAIRSQDCGGKAQ